MTDHDCPVNFFLIGAAKAGTTTLSHWLSSHPEIYIPPIKEPHYWALESAEERFTAPDGSAPPLQKDAVRDWDSYRALYGDAGTAWRLGDASNSYLYRTVAAERIHRARPDARIVAILRHPVARAASAYFHLRAEGREPLGFADAIRAEPERTRQNVGFLYRYVGMGMYGAQLGEWLEHFPREQILVLWYEDLVNAPGDTLRRVQRFLGTAEADTAQPSTRFNRRGTPRSAAVYKTLKRVSRTRIARSLVRTPMLRRAARQMLDTVMLQGRPELTRTDLDVLEGVFDRDLERLATLLDVELSSWREDV